MTSYNPEKDFVTARKVDISAKHYHEAIALINAKFAAQRASENRDSAYGSEPSSPGLSATSDSTAPEETPIDLTQDVEVTRESAAGPEHNAPVVITEEYDQAYSDSQNCHPLVQEWFRDQFVIEHIDSTPDDNVQEKLVTSEEHHDDGGEYHLIPAHGEELYRYQETEQDGFVLIESVRGDDSGIELTPPHSEDKFEISIELPTAPNPQFEHLANASLAVSRDVYEKTFNKQATLDIPPQKACSFGKCTTSCLSNPCYPVDQLIDNYQATSDEYSPKTTRIYLDVTGQASLISYPRSKSLRLLAQRLNEDVITHVVDMSELDNEHAKYRFEIDVSRFVRSRGVVVYSTSPVTDFYRDLEDCNEECDPCEKAQHEVTCGNGAEVSVPNLFLGTEVEFEEFAEEREFTKEQRDVVVFLREKEEGEDYLNKLEDFGVEVPMHNEMEEVSEYTRAEQVIRREKAKVFEESRKSALGTAIAETKDAIVLYSVEKETPLNFVQVYRRTSEEDRIDCEVGVQSLSGSDLLQKTVDAGDKDQVVQRVVAWLEKDDGHYEAMHSPVEGENEYSEDPSIISNKQKPCLSAALLAKYDQLIATTKLALQNQEDAPEDQDPEITFTFTLTNPTEANAAAMKKHIFLSFTTTASTTPSIHFSPPTQLLTIAGKNIKTCHEFNPLAINAQTLINTPVHMHTFPTGNCSIYTTQPIENYTLDYSLPEVKDAPRGNRKELSKFLRAHCERYLGWAPFAVRYRMNLGVVGVRELKCGEMVLGREEGGEDGGGE